MMNSGIKSVELRDLGPFSVRPDGDDTPPPRYQAPGDAVNDFSALCAGFKPDAFSILSRCELLF